MIEVFKILHNYYDSDVAPKLTLNNASVTRGNSLTLKSKFSLRFTEVFIPCSCGSGVIKILNMITLLN